MKSGDLGIHGKGVGGKKEKTSGVEECEMFTIAGLHMETRNKRRPTTEGRRSISDVK